MAKPFGIFGIFVACIKNWRAIETLHMRWLCSMFYIQGVSNGLQSNIFHSNIRINDITSNPVYCTLYVHSVNLMGKSSNLKLSDSGYSLFTLLFNTFYFIEVFNVFWMHLECKWIFY